MTTPTNENTTRRIRRRENTPHTINWGKFKGQSVEVLLSADDDYLSWLLFETEDDFAEREKRFLTEHGIVKD